MPALENDISWSVLLTSKSSNSSYPKSTKKSWCYRILFRQYLKHHRLFLLCFCDPLADSMQTTTLNEKIDWLIELEYETANRCWSWLWLTHRNWSTYWCWSWSRAEVPNDDSDADTMSKLKTEVETDWLSDTELLNDADNDSEVALIQTLILIPMLKLIQT